MSRNNWLRALPVVCLLGLGASQRLSAATVIDAFRLATAYNVFVFNDFKSSNTDIEGGLAAGGKVMLTGYSVGTAYGPMDLSKTPASAAIFTAWGSDVLVAAGGLTATYGSANGYVYAGTPRALTGFGTYGLDTRTTSPIPFAEVETQMDALSNLLAETSGGSGSCTVSGSTVNCVATKAGMNYLSVDGAALGGSAVFNFVDTTRGNATIVLNVMGNIASLKISGWNVTGIAADKVLVNFTGAQSISLNTSVFGSILAPYANVYGGWNQFNGNLIAESFTGDNTIGNTEFHKMLYSSSIPAPPMAPTPEPLSMALTGAGLVALAGVRHFRAR